MPALRSLTKNLSGTLTPLGALQSNLLNPGIIPRVSIRLNFKFPETMLLSLRHLIRGEGCYALAILEPVQCLISLNKNLILKRRN